VIRYCTVANNVSGVADWDGGMMTIKNSIIFNNGDYGDPQVSVYGGGTLDISYCDIQGGLEGIESDANVIWGLGNIDTDPSFVRLGYSAGTLLVEGNYHLRSNGWRLSEYSLDWVYADVTSRRVDGGNPGSTPDNELLMMLPEDPNNDRGVNLRVNMGAYSATNQASIAPYGWALLADLSNDGVVDHVDLAGQVESWLTSAGEQPGDLRRDGIVDMMDFAALANDWSQITAWAQ